MLSFDEIEDCFPDGACCDDSTGKTIVSAQWLHDFAHSVAAKEREACAKELEDRQATIFMDGFTSAAFLRKRPNE